MGRHAQLARLLAGLVCLSSLAGPQMVKAQPAPRLLQVHAAGSLRAGLSAVAAAFEAANPAVKTRLIFGASGLLKDRIAAGEPSDVFASANMDHPQALATAGLAGPVQRFARNAMCALVRPGLDVMPDNLVQRLLDPALTLGMSTPRADPAGDYALQVFARIEQAGNPGAAGLLAAKAQQLTGGPQSPPPPLERNVYGVLVAQGAADLFITYCTNTAAAVREQPGQRSVLLPDGVNVSTSYGVTLLGKTQADAATPAAADGAAFVDDLLSPAGQAVLAQHGFAPR